jgi:hypothetical protein
VFGFASDAYGSPAAGITRENTSGELDLNTYTELALPTLKHRPARRILSVLVVM